MFGSKLDAAKARYAGEVEHKFFDCEKNSTALAYIKTCNNKKEAQRAKAVKEK
jgi:hypothetical protein